jgi:hypothetical protein
MSEIWTPLSQMLRKNSETTRGELLENLPYRYRFTTDDPSVWRREPLPRDFFKYGSHDPVFDAVTSGGVTAWMLQVLEPSPPEQAPVKPSLPEPSPVEGDAQADARPRVGRPPVKDAIMAAGRRLQQNKKRYKTRAALAREVHKVVPDAKYKTVYDRLAGVWIEPGK